MTYKYKNEFKFDPPSPANLRADSSSPTHAKVHLKSLLP